jgi:hypothetical protein
MSDKPLVFTVRREGWPRTSEIGGFMLYQWSHCSLVLDVKVSLDRVERAMAGFKH